MIFWKKQIDKSGWQKSFIDNTLSEFNHSLKMIADKDLLRQYIESRVKEFFDVEQVYIFLLNEENKRYQIFTSEAKPLNCYFSKSDKLIFWLSANETYLDLIEKPDVLSFFSLREQDILGKLNVSLVYPLRVMNQTRGLIFLSGREDNRNYKPKELELLSGMLDQAAFAIENTILYHQQKERLKKMYRADRMSVMGQLAAGAAHEIRNPLTSIRSTIQYLSKDFENEGKREMVKNLINEVDRINKIITDLLSFARPGKPKMEYLDLDDLLRKSVKLLGNEAKKRNTVIDYQYNTEKKKLFADPDKLTQVFVNVIINSLQAIDNDGKIEIRVVGMEGDKGQFYYMIKFKDNGKGISKESLEKVFDPFYTTKTDGTGLGMSISYGIIDQHNGEISIKSTVNKGTDIIITLPEKQS
jgi:signal transduction histidine kinase